MEIIIGLAIFSVLLIVFFDIYIGFGEMFNFQGAQIEVTTQARTAINEITKYITQAHRVVQNKIVNGTTYNSGAEVLVLELPAIDTNSDIIADTWDYIACYLNNGKLYCSIEKNAASSRNTGLRFLGDIGQSVTFLYNNADFTQVSKVTIDIQAQKQAKQSSTNTRLTEQVFLRNF